MRNASFSTKTPSPSRRQVFTRRNRQKGNIQHFGQANSVQAFYEAPDFNEKNPKWVEYAPPSLPKAKKDKHEGAAIQTYRRRNPNDTREGFHIQKVRLQSPHLREALEETLEKFDVRWKDNLAAESQAPHRGLFFALDRIAEMAQMAEKSEVRAHCELLYTVVEEVFEETLDKLEVLEKDDMITFELLWTLFPEGHIFAELDERAPPRGWRVKALDDLPERLKITCEGVAFDGWRYGTYENVFRVYSFEGAVPISSIPGFSFVNVAEDGELRDRLLERGRRALELQTIQYMTFKPTASGNEAVMKTRWLKPADKKRVIIDPQLYRRRKSAWDVTYLPYYKRRSDDPGSEPDETERKEDRHQGERMTERLQKVDEGVLLRGHRDSAERRKRYMSLCRGSEMTGNSISWLEGNRRPTTAELEENRKAVLESEENLLIMHSSVSGYSVGEQAWEVFYIDYLHPVDVDPKVFDKVVMEATKKDVIKTLVESHKERQTHYDDLIDGKGQCLLIIFSGPPGTGKTLMVESLAEHLGCPLLRADWQRFQPDFFSALRGDDWGLGEFLNDATDWGGLVLFDEPDFLFQTQESDDDRKDLLAFLRHAEYFKGIIFLTTNLSRTIDSAVVSRAQIHLSFPSLTEPLRMRVWENFIDRLPDDVGTLSGVDVKSLATWQINGREIKNILNMSVSWCRKKQCLLSLEVVENLLTTICPSAKRLEDVEATNNVNSQGTKTSAADDMLLLSI